MVYLVQLHQWQDVKYEIVESTIYYFYIATNIIETCHFMNMSHHMQANVVFFSEMVADIIIKTWKGEPLTL